MNLLFIKAYLKLCQQLFPNTISKCRQRTNTFRNARLGLTWSTTRFHGQITFCLSNGERENVRTTSFCAYIPFMLESPGLWAECRCDCDAGSLCVGGSNVTHLSQLVQHREQTLLLSCEGQAVALNMPVCICMYTPCVCIWACTLPANTAEWLKEEREPRVTELFFINISPLCQRGFRCVNSHPHHLCSRFLIYRYCFSSHFLLADGRSHREWVRFVMSMRDQEGGDGGPPSKRGWEVGRDVFTTEWRIYMHIRCVFLQNYKFYMCLHSPSPFSSLLQFLCRNTCWIFIMEFP